MSERLAQLLRLPHHRRFASIAGIGGISHNSSSQSVVHFNVSSTSNVVEVEAVVLPKLTSDLPLRPVDLKQKWHHLTGLQLADPHFGSPSSIDLLLGVDIFIAALRHGRRLGLSGSPVAVETSFGWVLAGSVHCSNPQTHVVSHMSILTGDDLLRKFWEVEESFTPGSTLTPEERMVVSHFHNTHRRDEEGRFIVPLPRKPNAKPLGESRTQAVRRFMSLEHSLRSKNQFQEFSDVIQEYLDMSHAEVVPMADLQKPREEVFYLPMHAVLKESSTTTKIRAVFDASAKSSSGVALNDQLLVGPTIHSTLVDVLLSFRLYRVALTTDVSKMYRAVILPPEDRDLHRFVWRGRLDEPLKDYRMTRVTFGISSSSFAANMSVRQNAVDLSQEYPLAASAVEKSFYVDDGLCGADTVEKAVQLQNQLQALFSRGGFLLCKWKSSESSVLQHVPPHLLDSLPSHSISDLDDFAKTLGIEWSTKLDSFRLTVAKFPRLEVITKRALISDVAQTFDVLGWFTPSIIMIKVLLQQLWEAKVSWDEHVPVNIHQSWRRWREELPMLTTKLIPRCHFPKNAHLTSMQLHGFSDASEAAYAGVVYLRVVDSDNVVHVSLVMSKSKVASIKRLTIPRLELCGANLLANLLYHVRRLFDIPSDKVFAWTDSTVVLGWLCGNPRRFKTFVANRISNVVDLIAPDCWHHVSGRENPADSSSRGLFPSKHSLWWNGPDWLHEPESAWPLQVPPTAELDPSEEKQVCLVTLESTLPIMESFSSFTRLKRVTAWIFGFVGNCNLRRGKGNPRRGPLSVDELLRAERYWFMVMQQCHFSKEISALRGKRDLNKGRCLLPLHPILDDHGLLRVGNQSKLEYSLCHPIILHGNHPVTKLLISTEHLRLLHAGPTLIAASLSRRFHIVGSRRVIRSLTRGCVPCRRTSVKPKPQMLGQLPVERLTPGLVFEHVGVDYAGPVMIKRGYVRKPTLVKAYISVFISLTVRAVHLELVSDLTTEAFVAALRRFIARRGKPSLLWSDNGSNFVVAARELKEMFEFLRHTETVSYLHILFRSEYTLEVHT